MSASTSAWMVSNGLENAGNVKWDTSPLEYAVVISTVNTAHEFSTCLNSYWVCFDCVGLATVKTPKTSIRHLVQLSRTGRKPINSYHVIPPPLFLLKALISSWFTYFMTEGAFSLACQYVLASAVCKNLWRGDTSKEILFTHCNLNPLHILSHIRD
jgi:hypothetical protein